MGGSIEFLRNLMDLGRLFREKFWLVILLCFGAVFFFIVFPLATVLLIVVAIAVGLISFNTQKRQ